jgi:hypothetical protein
MKLSRSQRGPETGCVAAKDEEWRGNVFFPRPEASPNFAGAGKYDTYVCSEEDMAAFLEGGMRVGSVVMLS